MDEEAAKNSDSDIDLAAAQSEFVPLQKLRKT